MELRFTLSGSVLYSTDSDCVPTIGTVVEIKTESYKKGLHAGSVISVEITAENPPRYDYTELPHGIVYIDLNGYEVVSEGPNPDS